MTYAENCRQVIAARHHRSSLDKRHAAIVLQQAAIVAYHAAIYEERVTRCDNRVTPAG